MFVKMWQSGIDKRKKRGIMYVSKGKLLRRRKNENQRRSEVKSMENCVKAILYTYPKLSRIEEDYEDHIKNKATLSYRYRGSTEALTEYILTEILKKRRLAQLKSDLDQLFLSLTDEERLLLKIRYFGKIRRAKNKEKNKTADELSEVNSVREGAEKKLWSERTYYRKQERLLKKLMAKFNEIGLTKEVFMEELLEYEFLRMVYRFLTVKSKKNEG